MHLFAYILVTLSGMTSLIYQVLWQKQLSNLFGSHMLATALVLSTFFGFMAIGYHWIGRALNKVRKNRIWIYGLLEGGIGLYALISPFWFYSLTQYHQFVLNLPGSHLWAPIVFAILLMGLPTLLMGGTIPVLVEGLSNTLDVSHHVHSRIYALNTLGAFLGTLLSGFWLIETFGINVTLAIGGVINLIIFASTTSFRNKNHKAISIPAPPKANDNMTFILLAISFLSGFYVFGIENLVIRMAGVSLGSSVYTYSIVVGCFILGIALGALLAGRLTKYPPLRLLWLIGLGLVVTSLILYLSLPFWPEWFQRVRFAVQPAPMNFEIYWVFIFALLLLILCLPVALMGMNLPLLFYYLKSRNSFLSQTVGRLYAVNALGCVLGAFVGGYLLFFYCSGPVVFKILVGAMIASLVALSFLNETKKMRRWIWATSGFCMVALLLLPQWKAESFSPGLFITNNQAPWEQTFKSWISQIQTGQEPTVFAKYDVNTLVTVTKEDKKTVLYVNGKPDATTTDDATVRGMNMVVPLMIAPKIENIFVVGLGGGLSLGIASRFSEVKKVDVAELSKGVIEALPFFNEHDFDVLARKDKYQIFNEDAFSILQRRQTQYDVIVSEPSNPWVSGVEKLYSLDFLQMAASKLSTHGIYVQWFPLFQTTPESFLMVLKNFNTVFRWTTVWTTGAGVMMIVASNHSPSIDIDQLNRRFQENKDILKQFEITDPYSVLGRQILSPLLTRILPMKLKSEHTLASPKLAYQSGRAWVGGLPMFSLEEIILRTIPRPAPPGIPGIEYLYQDPKIHLSRQFFTDNLQYCGKYGLKTHPGTLFHWKRLNFEYMARFPKPRSKALESYFAYQRLIQNKLTQVDKKNSKAMLARWQSLIGMQLPTKTPKPIP